nr:hypothetical protein [Candidatus Burarchaeum sp.]
MGVFKTANYVQTGNEVVGFNSFNINRVLVRSSGEFEVSLSNLLDDKVTITEITVDGLPLTNVLPALPFNLSAGSNVTITADSPVTGTAGAIYNSKISIKFDVERGTSDHYDAGFLKGEFQPGGMGKKQCSNGLDDDSDTLTDFPADPGCSNGNDGNERNPLIACDDEKDNDNDGLKDYPADPGCSSPIDGDETDSVLETACEDGVNNDNDGLIDYPADPGCTGASDTSELGMVECDNNVDDDTDGYTDYPADTGCSSASDTSELGTVECNDGNDNDADGLIDYPADSDCSSPADDSEASSASCADTDGGINYTTLGSVSGYYNGMPYSYTDYCAGSYIAEHYCDGTVNKTSWYTCNSMGTGYTCSNGVCVPPAPPANCTDSDGALPMEPFYPIASQIGTAGTCTDANGIFTDISVNSTILNEFYCGPTQNPISCLNTTWYNCLSHNYTGSSGGKCIWENVSNNNSCSDSDGGLIYNVTGATSGYYNNTAYNYTDSCYNATWVNEQFCSGSPWQAIWSNSTVYACSNMGANYTCSAGKCVYSAPPPPNMTNCTDTDAYLQEALKYPLQSQIGVQAQCTDYRGIYYDTSQDSNWTSEYHCYQYNSSENRCGLTVYNCLSWNYTGSSGGKCVSSNNSCSDTDGGQIYNVTGTVNGTYNGANYSYTDTCSSGTLLQENYCSGTTNHSEMFTCTNMGAGYTCSGGKCIPPAANCTDTDSYLQVARNYPLSSQIGVYANCTDSGGGTYDDATINATASREFYCVSLTCYYAEYNCLSWNYTGSSGGKCYK